MLFVAALLLAWSLPVSASVHNGILVLRAGYPKVAANDSSSYSSSYQQRPSCVISAQPSTISQGQSSRLSWTSNYATSASLDHGIGAVNINGSFSVSPTATETFTLTVSGPGGTATCYTVVYVNQLQNPPSCSISANPSSTNASQNTTLTWSSLNATSASLSNSGSVAINGSMVVSPANTTTYTLSVNGSGGSATCQTVVYVNSCTGCCNGYNCPTSQAPSCTITIVNGYGNNYPNYGYSNSYQRANTYGGYQPSDAYDYNNAYGGTLVWSSSNASSASIDNGIGSVSVNGSRGVDQYGSRDYTMTVWGQGGSATCRASYYSNPPPQQRLACSIAAHSDGLGRMNLAWNSNGVSAWISNGVGQVAPSGFLATNTNLSGYITMTVQDVYGNTNSCSTDVPHSSAPYVALSQIPYTGVGGPIAVLVSWFSIGALLLAGGYLGRWLLMKSNLV